MEKKCLAFVKRLSKRLLEDSNECCTDSVESINSYNMQSQDGSVHSIFNRHIRPRVKTMTQPQGLADSIFEDPDQTSIGEAFTDAISSLPEGDLKGALLDNKKLYREKLLKKLQKRKIAENKSTNGIPLSRAETLSPKKFPYNFFRKDHYRIDPEAFSCLSGKQKGATYAHYLQNLLRFTTERRVMYTFVEETEAYKVWLQELEGSGLSGKPWGKDIESLIQIMSGDKNFNSVITVMKILLSKSEKEVDHLVQKKKYKSTTELAERLKKFLIVFHLKKKISQSKSSELEQAYVNLMSSLLSIFIDMTVLNSRKEERRKKIGKYICGFTNYLLSPWPQSRLDVLLQISVLDEEDSQIIMPLVRSVFSYSLKQDSGSNYETYLKHVLAVKFLSEKFQQEMADIVVVTKGKSAGDGFLDWLQEKCPEVLEEMPVNDKKFKGKQITEFLLDEADEDTLSKLLDALTGDTLISTEPEEGIQEEETWNSKHKDEEEETELQGKANADLFFLDTKGFTKAMIRDTKVQSGDDNQEYDEIHTLMEEEDMNCKENKEDEEEKMEEGSDQPPKDTEIFFLDTKGNKKVLDDGHKSEKHTNIPSPVKSKSPKKKRVGESDQHQIMDNEAGSIENKPTSLKKKKTGKDEQQIVAHDIKSELLTEANKESENNITMEYVTAGTDSFSANKESILLVPDLSVFLKSSLCSSPRMSQRDGKEMQSTRQVYQEKNDNELSPDSIMIVSESESEPDLQVNVVQSHKNVRHDTVNNKESGIRSNKTSPSKDLTLESKAGVSCEVDTSTSKARNRSTSQSKNSEKLDENMTPASKARSSRRRVSTLSTTGTTKQSPSATSLSMGSSRGDKEEREEEDKEIAGISNQKLVAPSSTILLNENKNSPGRFTRLREQETHGSSLQDIDVYTFSSDDVSCFPVKERPRLSHMRRMSLRQRLQDKDMNSEGVNVKGLSLYSGTKSILHDNQKRIVESSERSLNIEKESSGTPKPTFGSQGSNIVDVHTPVNKKRLASQLETLEGSPGKTVPASLLRSRRKTTSESSTSSKISTRSMTSRRGRGERSLVEKEVDSDTIQPDDDDPEILFSHKPAVQKNRAGGEDFKKSPSKEKSHQKGYSLRKKGKRSEFAKQNSAKVVASFYPSL